MAGRDDGLDKLESFIAQVTETQATFAKNSAQIEKLENSLNKLEDEAETAYEAFSTATSNYNEKFTEAHQDVLSLCDDSIEAIGELINDKLGEAITLIQDIGDAVDTAVNSFMDQMQSTFEELANDGYQFAEQGVQDLEQLVDDCESAANSAFEALESTVNNLKDLANSAKDAAMDTFNDVADNVTDAITSATDDAFSTFTNGLNTGLSNITSGLGDIGGLLTDAFDLFNSSGDEIGQWLMGMAGQILSDALSNITDTLMSEFERAFQEMVQEFIKELMGFIAESIAMMIAGSTTTGILSPYVPMLAIAKRIVGTINELLDLL
jgi:gas vesicle protein